MHILSILFLATLRDPQKFPASTAVAVLAFPSSYLKVPITFCGSVLAWTAGQAITFIFQLCFIAILIGLTEGDLLDLFVHYNSNSTLSDIKNATSFAVVNFVRHSFMDSTIYLKEKKKES